MCLAIPGEVVSLVDPDGQNGLRFAKVQFGGITRDVCLEFEPTVQVGDFVLVHVGFAIARIDRDEAARQWQVLRELGEASEPGAET